MKLKPDLNAKLERKTILKQSYKKNEKENQLQNKEITAKAPCATLMQPLQCHLRVSAAQDNSIADAAAAARNPDTAIPLRSADLVAKPPKKKHNGYTNCRSKTGSRHPKGKTTILKHFFTGK